MPKNLPKGKTAMANSPLSASSSNLIRFKRNFSLLSGASAAGIEIMADASADVVDALRSNTAFPAREIELAGGSVRAEGGKDIQFETGGRKVSFKGSANVFAGIGVYSHPARLKAALKADEQLADGLDLQEDATHRYLMLRWGYDVKATARGSMALGGGIGSVKFGVDAARDGLFAVIHRMPGSSGARTALQNAVDCWMPLREVASAANLEPGTWLLTEVDGSIGLSLGATFGYDFNWIKETELVGLTGDIGLRIQLGIAAQLGFSASGKYCVVVSRESPDPADQALRLRLFKLSYKGWNFALNAGATVQPDFGILPNTADDFIKGVFGVYGAQIVKDLKAIEKWTDPSKPLPDLLADLGSDYVKQLLKDLTGVSPATAFNEARARLLGFLKSWDELPHRASTMLWKLIDEGVDLTKFRAIIGEVAQADKDSLQKLINKNLAAVDFFRTPEGMMLESLAVGNLLAALTNSRDFVALKSAAETVGNILDPGGALLDVLKNLQKHVNTALDLEKVRQVVSETDFQSLDVMLKQKLSAFLGKTIEFGELEKVRKTIDLLLSKRQEFYGKAIKALKRKYEFEFAASYHEATTSTALIDVEFDFGAGAADLPALWSSALNGEFDSLLLNKRPDVKLNSAALTHGVKRNTHIEISLPFYKATVDHINNSLAKSTVVEEDGGRLIVYELKAEDLVTTKSVLPWKKTERDSRLAIGAFLPVEAAEGRLRIHSTDTLTYTYSFDQARGNMKRGELQYQLKPLVEKYLEGSFGDGSASFDTWISDLDKTIDEIEDNGSDNFGNTLLSLDLTLPGSVPAAWLRAPADENDFGYMEMSRNIQKALKSLVPNYYFQDTRNYEGAQPSACALMVYAALPASTQIKLEGSSLAINLSTATYWDFLDDAKRRAMIFNKKTETGLATAMKDVHDLLNFLGRKKDAEFYRPEELGKIQRSADTGIGEQLLIELLRMEAQIIRAAGAAGLRLAEFRGVSGKRPQDAVKALEEFGSKLTDAFNAKVSSVYGGGALRALGTMVFVEAARAFAPELNNVKPNVILQLTVTKKAVPFPPEGFPNDLALQKKDIVIEQRLVSVGVAQ